MIYAEQVGEWIKVSFRHNAKTTPTVVKALRSIPGWFFNPQTHNWGIPYERVDEFTQKLGRFLIIWSDGRGTEGRRDWGVPDDAPVIPYEFKVKPFKHQIVGFNVLVSYNRLIEGDDMGLGKTFQTLTAMEARHMLKQIKRVLIITKASLLYNWKKEVGLYTRQACRIIGGTRAARLKAYSELYKDKTTLFIITSYETYRNDYHQFLDHNFDVIVLDEAQKIKGWNSKIGTVIHNLPADYKYALTGTPIINTPLESYNLLKWLGIERRTWWNFRNRYAIMGGYENKEVVAFQNLNELQRTIQSVLLRRLKTEVLDLPPKIKQVVLVDLTPSQRRSYSQIRGDIIHEVNEGLNAKPGIHPLTKLIRLKQCTSSLNLLDVDCAASEVSAKVNTLKDYLEDICENHKAVVFTQFKTLVNHLLTDKEIMQYNPAVVTGDVAAMGKNENDISARQRAVDKFQTDSTCRLFIGTLGACREGLTLTEGNYVFFIDEDWAEAYNEQAEDRCFRIGQKKTVNVYRLRCKDTIDEVIGELLLEKADMFDGLIDLKQGAGEQRMKVLLEKVLAAGG